MKAVKPYTTVKPYVNTARRFVSDKKRPVVATIKIYVPEQEEYIKSEFSESLPQKNKSSDLSPSLESIKKKSLYKKYKEFLSKKIKKILNDEETIDKLKKLNIEISDKDPFIEVSDKLENSNSEISRPTKYEPEDKEAQKKLFNMIINPDKENDTEDKNIDDKSKQIQTLMKEKKSLSIVYELDDIINKDKKMTLIQMYEDFQNNKDSNFSKYIKGTNATVVKLFKMNENENDSDFTHVLISRDVGADTNKIPEHTMRNLLELFSGVDPTEWTESQSDKSTRRKIKQEIEREQREKKDRLAEAKAEDEERNRLAKETAKKRIKEQQERNSPRNSLRNSPRNSPPNSPRNSHKP